MENFIFCVVTSILDYRVFNNSNSNKKIHEKGRKKKTFYTLLLNLFTNIENLSWRLRIFALYRTHKC